MKQFEFTGNPCCKSLGLEGKPLEGGGNSSIQGKTFKRKVPEMGTHNRQPLMGKSARVDVGFVKRGG